MVSRELDVVEADHGNVLGHVQIGIAKGANRTDGGHVIEGDDRRESLVALQEGLNHRITQLWRRNVTLQLNGEFWVDGKAQLFCHSANVLPAGKRVRAERLPTHESDVLVAEFHQMPE